MCICTPYRCICTPIQCKYGKGGEGLGLSSCTHGGFVAGPLVLVEYLMSYMTYMFIRFIMHHKSS